MLKVNIPSATSMADLAEQKKQKFEEAVMGGPVFRELLQRIETAALGGRTEITIALKDHEHSQDMKVIKKYLEAAGYRYETVKSGFPLNLIPAVTISWDAESQLEGR